MNTKYAIKAKPQGAAKYTTFGNVTPGERGPRMGLKNTPELRAYLASVADGQWINFLLFEVDEERRPAPAPKPGWDDSEGIPF